MARKKKQHSGAERLQHPEEWTTGDQPMTDAQRGYVEALANRTGERVDRDMSKAEASEKIDELKEKTGQAQ